MKTTKPFAIAGMPNQAANIEADCDGVTGSRAESTLAPTRPARCTCH
jgi:hypothetical protein